MPCSRFVVAALVAAAAAVGCASQAGEGDLDVAADQSALQLAGTRYLGPIVNGETKSGEYGAPPVHRAFGFVAKGGDTIQVRVSSLNGDAIAFITDKNYNVLAANDDASADTYDAEVKLTLPPAAAARELRIVFRDHASADVTFTAKLTVHGPGPATCNYDGRGYVPGDTFASTDGCNTCTCNPAGAVACTTLTCACNPASEPNRIYLGTAKECLTLHYSCEPGQIPFANSCGCGCEIVGTDSGSP